MWCKNVICDQILKVYMKRVIKRNREKYMVDEVREMDFLKLLQDNVLRNEIEILYLFMILKYYVIVMLNVYC